MSKLSPKRIILESEEFKDKIIKRLSKSFRVSACEEDTTSNQVYYDSFDWRLFNSGMLLVQADNRMSLLQACNDNLLGEEQLPDATPATLQSPNFNDTTLRNNLEPVLAPRAVQPVLSLQKSIKCYCIEDEEQRIVAKVHFESFTLAPDNTKSFLSTALFIPENGYKLEFKLILERLKKKLIIVEANEALIYELALKVAKQRPGNYSARPVVKLKLNATASEAMSKVSTAFLDIARKNEAGIIDDIDTEFLHDYRVSIRKLRSILKQLKGVYNEEITTQALEDFATMARTTNSLRDLDVFLLKTNTYMKILPPELNDALEPFTQHLRDKREREYKRVIRHLKTKKYQALIGKWQTFFDSEIDPESLGENGNGSILKQVKGTIFKRFKQVITFGRLINDETQDKDLHRLRIQCKKLRYQLELFQYLFPQKEIQYLIRHLKVLQTNLGNYNDLSVQLRTLTDYLMTIKPRQTDAITNAAAIGALIGQLSRMKHYQRQSFHQSFEQFDHPKVRRLFKQLFKK